MNDKPPLSNLHASDAPVLGSAIAGQEQHSIFAEDMSSGLEIIEKGLHPTSQPVRILVIGAGMAGLVAAYELLRAGHKPLILEAHARVGGRVLTLRDDFAAGLYAEAGAMRIPSSHRLTMAYAKRFNLPLMPFTMDQPLAFSHLGGVRRRIKETPSNASFAGFRFFPQEEKVSLSTMWEQALEPFRARLREKGGVAWPAIVDEFDAFSIRDYLESAGWSAGAIELFGLFFNQEALMSTSFLELLREELSFSYRDLIQIEGGMDSLPAAFLSLLRPHTVLGAEIIALDQSPDSITVSYRTPAGILQAQAPFAILAIPFSALRHIDVLKPFSSGKMAAIRQLHYDAAAKVFLQCRRRFWEEDDGIFGGRSVTDLPLRNIYYPEHGRETGRGVLLASYTWGEDAQRWGSLPANERITLASRYLSRLHPQAPENLESGISMIWHEDRFAGGAFALFEPGQQTRLAPLIAKPEGRYFFAGEHVSLCHGWIQGAISSGLAAAQAVHAAAEQ